MNRYLLLSIALLANCAAQANMAESKDWVMFSEAPKFKAYYSKSDLSKGTFGKPFLLRTKSVIEYGQSNRSGDSTGYSTYYIDCQNMREALADVRHEKVGSSGELEKPEREIFFDARQLPPASTWKSMGIDVNDPSNFCRNVAGWNPKGVKQAYPNANWLEVPDSPLYFLNMNDLSFATLQQPFPVRVKAFVYKQTDYGESSAITFTEMIDCKKQKSRSINRVFTANDTVMEENQNPQILHAENIDGIWRPFNTENKIFTLICTPLEK